MTFANTPQLLKVVFGSALLFLTAGFGFVVWSRNSEAGWISLGVVAIFALLLGAGLALWAAIWLISLALKHRNS